MSKKSKENEDKPQYSFPTVVACPRCHGTQTRARSTQGRIQYRICLAPICRHRYAEKGTLIENRKEHQHEQETSNK